MTTFPFILYQLNTISNRGTRISIISRLTLKYTHYIEEKNIIKQQKSKPKPKKKYEKIVANRN